MRRSQSLGGAAAVLGCIVFAACGSSARNGTAPGSTRPARSTTSGSRSSSSTTTTTTGVNPNAPELNAAGDIPDNQVFVKYTPRTATYSVEVPEGWARTDSGATTTFASHFNSIHISATKSAAAPTVTTARTTEIPTLQHDIDGFALGNVTTVSRAAGVAVLVTYGANSAPDPVTGKRVALDVERYEFWRTGTQVTLTLSAPHGADNVDPWKKVTESFAWPA